MSGINVRIKVNICNRKIGRKRYIHLSDLGSQLGKVTNVKIDVFIFYARLIEGNQDEAFEIFLRL